MGAKKVKTNPSKKEIVTNDGTLYCGTSTTLNGVVDMTNGTTTTSTGYSVQYNRTLENVKFIENDEGNFMEITYRLIPTFQIYTTFSVGCGETQLVKERYGVVKGKMTLIKTIKGIEKPGYYVEPTSEWED